MSQTPARPMRVLLAWELGANLGHLLRLLPIARALQALGHVVSLAVPDPAAVRERMGDMPWEVLRIPRPVHGDQSQPACFAQILAMHGFGSDALLGDAMQAWQRLLSVVKPDVLLADHAPLALLAGRLYRVPTVHVATGWESPPFGDTLPILRPEMPEAAPDRVRALEDSIVARINRLCAEHQAPAMQVLGEVFRAQLSLLATWPEIDHLQPRPDRPWFAAGDSRRQPTYIGPLFSVDTGAVAAWPQGEGPRVFVYMQRGPSTVAVLRHLGSIGARVVASVPGASLAERDAAGPSCSFHDAPVRLDSVLPQVDLVVSHGSHGLTAASLLAGVPMVSVPMQMEQATLTQQVRRLGAAELLRAADVESQGRQLMQHVLDTPSYREAAAATAGRHAGFDPRTVTLRIAASIEHMGRHFAQSQTTPIREAAKA
jgi:UDP:flavonoid glycosyltransferase YjiC (YdhE family)